jgi:hypothetical protein
MFLVASPPTVSAGTVDAYNKAQWDEIGFDPTTITNTLLSGGDTIKGASAAAPLFYLFAGFCSFCVTLTVVGSTSYAARTYRSRKKLPYDEHGRPPEPAYDDDGYIIRDGPPDDFYGDRPGDDFFDDDYYPDYYEDEYGDEDEEYADEGEEIWMVEEDEAVPEINMSTWQAMPDEEIAELPMSSNVARMTFYADSEDDGSWGESFYPTVGGFPGALAMKDDDYIEAAGGDFDDFGSLRDLGRRQESMSPTGGISMFGGPGPSAPGGGVGGMIASAFGGGASAFGGGADPFAVGDDFGDEVAELGLHGTSNVFEGQRGANGALLGGEMDLVPEDPFGVGDVPVIADDDNYIVLEL